MGINRIKGDGDYLAEVNSSQELLIKNTDMETLITTLDAVIDAIKAQTDKLTFDGSNNLKVTL